MPSVRADEYKAQIKQLGARGRVRVANKDRSCGSMRLWVYQDRVSPIEIQSLFPGADIDIDPSAYNRRHGVQKGRETFKTKVLKGLKSLPPTTLEIEVEQLGKLIDDPNLKTRGTRLADSNAAWTMLGWSFVPGTKGRGGTKARFVRAERPSSLAA